MTIVQSHLHWENPVANRELFSEIIKDITEEVDIIVLPEMFTTGFTMNASELAEETQGETIKWMVSEAEKKSAAILGSIIIREKEHYFNRLFFVSPKGTIKTYDKRHTFTLAGEHKTYKAGTDRLIVNYKGWKICPLICYDLRFPVWARNTEDYDLLIYTANWPKKRISAWDALLRARAIENMCYCLGVNRVGLDGNGHEYIGHSSVYDALGEQLRGPNFEMKFVHTFKLEKEHINSNRKHLQFLNDRDDFNLK